MEKTILKLMIFCVFATLASCLNTEKNDAIQSRALVAKTVNNSDSLKNFIQGYWSDEKDGFVYFVVEKDSLWYPDKHERYFYSLTNDILAINYKNRTDTFLIQIRGHDTLVTISPIDTSILIRSRSVDK